MKHDKNRKNYATAITIGKCTETRGRPLQALKNYKTNQCRTFVPLYLDCDGLVVFETTQSILRFQGVAVGILRGVEGGRRQVFPAIILTTTPVKSARAAHGA